MCQCYIPLTSIVITVPETSVGIVQLIVPNAMLPKCGSVCMSLMLSSFLSIVCMVISRHLLPIVSSTWDRESLICGATHQFGNPATVFDWTTSTPDCNLSFVRWSQPIYCTCKKTDIYFALAQEVCNFHQVLHGNFLQNRIEQRFPVKSFPTPFWVRHFQPFLTNEYIADFGRCSYRSTSGRLGGPFSSGNAQQICHPRCILVLKIERRGCASGSCALLVRSRE